MEGCRLLARACELAALLPGFRVYVAGVDPASCGARRTLGSPRRGKVADHEIPLHDCSRCHVVVGRDGVLEVHRDAVSPLCSPLGHLMLDAWKHLVGAQGVVGLAVMALGNTWLGAIGVAGALLTLAARALLGLARW